MSIDALALQELRETCEEVLEGAVGEQVFDTKDAALIIALMDERDARLDSAPEPEGLREAVALCDALYAELTPDGSPAALNLLAALREALARPTDESAGGDSHE